MALTKRIYLLDCPGIVPATASDFAADCAKVLKGVVRAERIQIPSDYIDEVLTRVKKPYLLQRYKLAADTEWSSGEDFLTILARKMGKLLKGGDPDIDTAARIVLYDWQRGRIPYFTQPPDDRLGEEPAEVKFSAGGSSSSAAGEGAAETEAPAEGAEEGKASTSTEIVLRPEPLAGITCAHFFDDDDRRGEAPPSEAPGSRVQKRRADKEEKEGEDEAPASSGRGKKRRQGAAPGRDGPVPGRRAGAPGAPAVGSADWKAMVAEFGV